MGTDAFMYVMVETTYCMFVMAFAGRHFTSITQIVTVVFTNINTISVISV